MNNRSRRLFLILLIANTIGISLKFFSVQVLAWEIDKAGTVYYIVDGDTLDATSVGRIRLADIDTPESGQPGYAAAKNYLSSLVYDKLIYIDVDDVYGTDIYGRTVAVIYVRYDDERLLNVNFALWNYGYADLDNYPNEFNPNTWTMYVSYPVSPPPDPPEPPDPPDPPDPPPPPSPYDKPDLKDRGSDYSGFTPYQVLPGDTSITILCDILNIGNASSGNFRVNFYASSDSTITTSDYYIGFSYLSSIGVDLHGSSSFSGTFPSLILDGEYYIGFLIDPYDWIDELNEVNNEGCITLGQVLVDGTPPSSLISLSTLNATNRINKSTVISFTCSDKGGSGVSCIFYSIDGGEWKEYTGNFTLKGYDKGSHLISYYSTDTLDNAEEIKSIMVIKTDLSSTEISHTVSIIIIVAVIIGSIVTVGLTLVLRREYKKRKGVRKDSLIKEPQGEKKMVKEDVPPGEDPVVKFIVSDLLGQYSEIIIAIYGIGSYFDDSLPQDWAKNDLDIIVIVKSLEIIPKRKWTEIRYKKKIIDGNNVWLGFNTLEAYQNNMTFSKESVSNYEWSLIDLINPENSKLLGGKDIRDQLPDSNELTFDHDDVLARGLYHLNKSLGEKETSEAMKAFSKAIFKIGFYFCIFLDKSFQRTSILEIGNKMRQFKADYDFLEKMVAFNEEAIIYRITGSFITEFSKLRDDFMKFLSSLLEEGKLHRRMSSKELTLYLKETFNGFSNIIQWKKLTDNKLIS